MLRSQEYSPFEKKSRKLLKSKGIYEEREQRALVAYAEFLKEEIKKEIKEELKILNWGIT